MGMPWGSRQKIGLALRPKHVEVVVVGKEQIEQTVRIPVEGPEEAQQLQAVQSAVDGAKLKGKRVTAKSLFRSTVVGTRVLERGPVTTNRSYCG